MPTVQPYAQRAFSVATLTLTLTHLAVLLFGELVGQMVQQILRSRLALNRFLLTQLAFQLLAEIEHFAPKVILLRPAYEIGNLLAPFVAVSHVEHHTFQPRYHIGTIGKNSVGLALIELGSIFVLLLYVERQAFGLRTFYQAVGSLQTVDVGLQLLCELMVVDAQDGCHVVIIVAVDNRRNVQSAHRTVVHHLEEEFAGIRRCRAGVEVPAQRSDATDRIGTYALLTGITVVEGLSNQQTYFIHRTLRCHLLQSLYLIHNGIDEALTVVVGIHDALVKHGIRQVVNQHLDADIRRARVFLLLGSRVLLFPFCLTLAVRLVALLDVIHDELDRLFDSALTD